MFTAFSTFDHLAWWAMEPVSFLAGVLAGFSPCSLAVLPLALAYAQQDSGSIRTRLIRAVLISLGSATGFVIMGVIIHTTFSLLRLPSFVVYGSAGILMIAMALQTIGIVELVPSRHVENHSLFATFLGAFLFGLIASFFSSPCSTPVLVGILTLTVQSETMWQAMLLMACYGAGHAVSVLCVVFFYRSFSSFLSSAVQVIRFFHWFLAALYFALGIYFLWCLF